MPPRTHVASFDLDHNAVRAPYDRLPGARAWAAEVLERGLVVQPTVLLPAGDAAS